MEHRFYYAKWKNKHNVCHIVYADFEKFRYLLMMNGAEPIFGRYSNLEYLKNGLERIDWKDTTRFHKFKKAEEGFCDTGEEERLLKLFDEAEKTCKKPEDPNKGRVAAMEAARKKYEEIYHELMEHWLGMIEQAEEVAFEKYGTRALSVYIATEQNRLVFYAMLPGERKGKFLYRRDGGQLMKEAVELVRVQEEGYSGYVEVVNDWQEDLGHSKSRRISTDFYIEI